MQTNQTTMPHFPSSIAHRQGIKTNTCKFVHGAGPAIRTMMTNLWLEKSTGIHIYGPASRKSYDWQKKQVNKWLHNITGALLVLILDEGFNTMGEEWLPLNLQDSGLILILSRYKFFSKLWITFSLCSTGFAFSFFHVIWDSWSNSLPFLRTVWFW